MPREGYWENGKVKHCAIIKLSHCSAQQIAAIRIALKKKDDFSALRDFANAKPTNGKHVGAFSSLYQIAHRLGIVKALGAMKLALLVLWIILARLINQGSRLSAVRLAQNYAVCEILGLEFFTEDDLYQAMDWLSAHQDKIEQHLLLLLSQKAPRHPLYKYFSTT